MKVKSSKRLINELVRCSENPREFVYGIMALQNQTATDLAARMNMTSTHFYVTMNGLKKGNTVLPKTIVDIANGLDIDPFVLNSFVHNHALKVYLENQKSGGNN